MNLTSDLPDLVRSLSRQEKRYFKQYATAHIRSSENTYTLMFDIVAQNVDRDDRTIHELLQASGLVANLPAAKNKLTNLVLDSLAEFHATRSVSAQLRRMLNRVEVLYNKGLYSHCRKVLSKIRIMAEKVENYNQLMEVLFWEWKLLFRSIDDSMEQDVRENSAAIKDIADRLRTIAQYRELLGLAHAAIRRNPHSRTESDRNTLEALINTDLMSDPSLATSFSARLSYLKVHSFHSWTSGDFIGALEYNQNIVDHWGKHPQLAKENPDTYSGDLVNYLTCCIALKKFDVIAATLAKIQAHAPRSRGAEIQRIEQVYVLELSYCLNFGLLEQGLAIAERIDAGMRAHAGRIAPNRRINLNLNCAIAYFLAERYGPALEHIHDILQENRELLRRDVQQFARVFRLVLHFETGDYGMLDNLLRSTRQFLKKRAGLFPLERVIIGEMKKLLNTPKGPEQEVVLRAFQGKLIDFLHESGPATPTGLIELLFWLEAKVEKRPLPEIYSEKVRPGVDTDKRKLFPAN